MNKPIDKNLPKAAAYAHKPDVSVLQEFFDEKPDGSVNIDGKTVKSRFNPIEEPSKYNCQCGDPSCSS